MNITLNIKIDKVLSSEEKIYDSGIQIYAYER